MENEMVLFETKDKEISIRVAVGDDTVWLSANQMALLFDRDEKTIRKHINSIFREEELNKENNTQKMRVDGVKQRVPFYTLDVIISVGYRVKSQRGIEFRQWANSVLKQYIINAKIRLVQNLLTYSDYSCIEIASYLGFSSQSHMGEHFRRVTGMTPRKYREKYRKNDFLNEFR